MRETQTLIAPSADLGGCHFRKGTPADSECDPLRRVLVEVAGLDAERILQKLCCNDIGGSVGRVTYTAMLNQRGGIETDCLY